MEGILARLNTRVLKEPRGFMKVLQFVFSICAFATTTSFFSEFSFQARCKTEGPDPVVISGEITYPFRLDRIHKTVTACNTTVALNVLGDFSSDARFFVAIGVLAFLYSVAALVLYCFLSDLYENNDMVPLGDFAAHVLFAVLWFAASCAWANSLDGLRYAASLDTIMNYTEQCKSATVLQCNAMSEARFGKLISSVIFGFLNIFLWASNLWFLYKETKFYKDRKALEASATEAN